MRRPSTQVILGAAAIFAGIWVIARACVQSITIDEADTYLVWVARPDPSYWSPATNNHLLNSVLMRVFTGLFGLSHLSFGRRRCWERRYTLRWRIDWAAGSRQTSVWDCRC